MFYHARAKLAMLLAAELPRLILFAPIFLGLGILSCLLPLSEPPLWIAPALLLSGLVIGFFGRTRFLLLFLGLAIGLIGLGHGAARLRIMALDQPMITAPRIVTVTGIIAGVEHLPTGDRVLIEMPKISGRKQDTTPHLIRLRFDQAAPAVGSTVKLKAVLMPPPPPALPGAHDFQRDLWFEGIGAIGFARGQVQVTGLAPPAPGLWLEQQRAALAKRIAAAVRGPSGQVLVALFAGQRDGIPEEINNQLRDSGLYHMLSISGLHIALVAGLGFTLARMILLLFLPWSLTAPVKKYAAIVALLLTIAYMVLVGISAPTLRSVVMVALAMLAIIADRSPFSPRLLAVAATLVLLMQPEALLGASFQMSFAAALALIAGFEALEKQSWWRLKPDGRLLRLLRVALALAVTSLLATLATAPFAWYHFQRLQLLGIVANMIAVPLSSFWVMPFGLLAYPLLPFGLEQLALIPAGWGMDAILWISAKVASWPGAAITLPLLPPTGLALMAAGLLLLCLLQTRLRLIGLLIMFIGALTALTVPAPDLLADSGSRLIALRTSGTGYAFNKTGGYQGDVWQRSLRITSADHLTGTSARAITAPNTYGPCADGEIFWRDRPFQLTLCGHGLRYSLDKTSRDAIRARWTETGWLIESMRQERGARIWVP